MSHTEELFRTLANLNDLIDALKSEPNPIINQISIEPLPKSEKYRQEKEQLKQITDSLLEQIRMFEAQVSKVISGIEQKERVIKAVVEKYKDTV